MPIISTFFGIVVRVFHEDHEPPHVHVQYGEYKAVVQIATGRVLAGRLPPRVKRILLEWLRLRRVEVMRTWIIARDQRIPPRVRPLE